MANRSDYVVTIDESQVLTALQRIERRFDQMEKSGNDAFAKVTRGSGASASIIGNVVGGTLQDIGRAAFDFGREALAAFTGSALAAQKAAAAYELTRRKFTSIFQGQEKLASAVMDRIGQRASELGLDLNEALSFSRAFLPDVRGTANPLEQIDNLLVAVRGLGEEDPFQGVMGARFAIEEAMSGTLTSLRRRFEFTRTEMKMVKDAMEEYGDVVGTIEGVNAVLQRRGVDIATLKGTYNQSLGELSFAVSKFQIDMGKPISREFTESLVRLGATLKEQSDPIQLLAGSIGDGVAMIADFLGAQAFEFIESLDLTQMLKLSETLGESANHALTLADIILELDLAPDALTNVDAFLGGVNDILVTVQQIVAILKASKAFIDAYGESFLEIKDTATLLLNPIQNLDKISQIAANRMVSSNEDFGDSTAAATKAQEAFNKSFADSMGAFDAGRARMEEATAARRERIAAQEEDTEAALEAANADLRGTEVTKDVVAALKEEAAAAKETAAALREKADAMRLLGGPDAVSMLRAAENAANEADRMAQSLAVASRRATRIFDSNEITAQAEAATEAIASLEEGLDDRLEDIAIKRRQRAEDNALSDQRAAAARDKRFLESREALEKSHAERMAKAVSEMSEPEQKLIQDQGKARVQLEQDIHKRLEDNESAFQEKISEIRRSASRRLEQAEINQDALAFVDILREQEIAEEEARISRDQTREEVVSDAEERRSELQAAQAEERQLISENNQNKLEELQAQYLREQQALDEAEARELEAKRLADQHRAEDQAIADRREEERILLQQQRKLENITAGLDSEVAAVIEAEAAKVTAIENFSARAIEVLQELMFSAEGGARRRGRVGESSRSFRGRNNLPASPLQFAAGGRVRANEPVIVGELGREMYIPDQNGLIVNNAQLKALPESNLLSGGSTTNNFAPRFELSNPAVLSPEQAQATLNIAESTAINILRRLLSGESEF